MSEDKKEDRKQYVILSYPVVSSLAVQKAEGLCETRRIGLNQDFVKTLRKFNLYVKTRLQKNELEYEVNSESKFPFSLNDICRWARWTIEAVAEEKYLKNPALNIILGSEDAIKFEKRLLEDIASREKEVKIRNQLSEVARQVVEQWNKDYPDFKISPQTVLDLIDKLPTEVMSDDEIDSLKAKTIWKLTKKYLLVLIRENKELRKEVKENESQYKSMTESLLNLRRLIFKLIKQYNIPIPDLVDEDLKNRGEQNVELTTMDIDELASIYQEFEPEMQEV